jgi:Transcriptional regulator
MDLLQLKYFKTVAKNEHMTQAAEELHIAQPSLSKVISRLEEDLGVPLFDRIGRQIKLNQFGKVFLHRVERMFLELEDGKKEISDILGREDQRISFSVNNLYSISLILEKYITLHPHASFRQVIGTSSKMHQLVQNGDVDFCLSSPPIEGDYIESIPIETEELYLFVPNGHRFADRKSIKLIEAANEPFISLPEGFGLRDLTEELCKEAGFSPNIVFESHVSSGLIELININLGVSLLPIPKWSSPINNLPVALHIEPVCTRTIALSYIKGRFMPKATKHFIDFIVNYFKNIG